jgi:predicted ester cyclase
MSNVEKNKATFKRLFDQVVNEGRLDLADQFLTVDRPDHQVMGGMTAEQLAGYGGFRMVIGMLRGAFPDLRFTSQFMIGEGDRVLSYNLIEGTHTGAFMGFPATGKKFRATAADVCRFNEAGFITEHWGVFDMLGLMSQLGMVPAR